ncbi:hypothetical protein [Burkholderia ubonensis]|uniref:hypothetical protein n=1 Tax=Burkholderia ubonensis TaxID=101571 RepID=UPI000AB66A36|nr:hypothetical protein [Burkholderia ubonensis]
MAQSITGYGLDFEVNLSKREAKALCGMYPLPAIGNETIVAVAPDGYGGRYRLYVQNVSGMYVLASYQVRRAKWKEVFGVEVRYA